MTVAWSDLGGALIAGGIWLAIIACVLAVLVWDARRRRVASITLEVTGAVARMWVAVVILGAVLGFIGLFTAPTITLTEFPVGAGWPTPLPCDGPGGPASAAPTLYCARILTATAEVAGLGAGIKTLIFIGGLLAYATAATPGVLVAVLSGRAGNGRPFDRSSSRWLLGSALVILVAGMLSEVLLAIARFLAAGAVLPDGASGAAITAAPTFQMVLPVWPIGASLALAALAVVFRYGSRLQRDTEGLV